MRCFLFSSISHGRRRPCMILSGTGSRRYLQSIKAECDWMDENFELRKEARESEIEGLDDAKSASPTSSFWGEMSPKKASVNEN